MKQVNSTSNVAGWVGPWSMLSLAAILAVVGFVPAARGADSGKNVILIGWDGSQRNHVNEMIERKELPNLVALAKEGAMVATDVISGATDTKAGWTQILTGYAPEKTGVYSNGKYQPIPVGYTIFERVEKALGPDNVETRAMIGKKGHVDADGPTKIPYEKWLKREQKQKKIDKARPGLGNLAGGKVVEENGEKYVVTPGKPYYNTKDHMDMFVNGLTENQKVGEMALKNLEQCRDKRFLFFVHFAEPDHSGHQHGENSQEYSDALKSDDEWTGKIVAKLKELGIYDKTLVYVVVDHGFNEDQSGHGYAPYVFIATNDKQVTRKAAGREDIAPTVLERFGIDLANIEPPLDGFPLDKPAPDRFAPAEKPGATQKKPPGPSQRMRVSAKRPRQAPPGIRDNDICES
ncbi:MAG: alkaline phosphatase family protein [Planctomycetota bacterium]